MKQYTVHVCAGCGAQGPSRPRDHARNCPHRRYKWYQTRAVRVIPYSDYARVVNVLLAEKGAKCTCQVSKDHDPKCPYHGDDGTRVAFLSTS